MKLFNELMTYQESVFRICLGFSKNPWDAEELTQEVYLKAYKKISTLKDSSLSRPWLFQIAKNICLDHSRKNRLGRFCELGSDNEPVERKTPESLICHKEQLQILKKAVRQLPKKLKEVFILKEYGHLSYQEIASTLEIKEGTVMSRLYRARQAVINQIRRESYEK
ncbi:MAG: RNA polymerase sigma factor [Candidatus Aminicenantia bacterium]